MEIQLQDTVQRINEKSTTKLAQELKTKRTFKGSKKGALHQLQKLFRSCNAQKVEPVRGSAPVAIQTIGSNHNTTIRKSTVAVQN